MEYMFNLREENSLIWPVSIGIGLGNYVHGDVEAEIVAFMMSLLIDLWKPHVHGGGVKKQVNDR